jgi:hypothetical protein
MTSRYGPNGPVALPAGSFDMAALTVALEAALALPDNQRDAAVERAIANNTVSPPGGLPGTAILFADGTALQFSDGSYLELGS